MLSNSLHSSSILLLEMVANLSATSSKLEASWRLVAKLVTENSPTCWNLLAGRRAESLFVFPLHLIQSDFSTSCYLVVQLRHVELENRVKNESKTLFCSKRVCLFVYCTYLLLVDVGLRSFTSCECPTRCRHRDASWRSRLYQHQQHATVVNSNVTRLCSVAEKYIYVC